MGSFKTVKLALFGLLLVALGCKEEDKNGSENGDDDIKVHFKTALQNRGTPLSIGDTVTMQDGTIFNVKKFKLYLSHLSLVSASGDTVLLNEVLLADVGDPATGAFRTTVPAANYVAVLVNFGLDPILNDSDPTGFPNEHPLSTYQAMYWSMLKYRFAIIEGRSNASGQFDPASDALNAYHPGTDPLYRQRIYEISMPNANTDLDFTLEIDLDGIFYRSGNSIDLQSENQTHSEPVDIDIAIRLMNNLAATTRLMPN